MSKVLSLRIIVLLVALFCIGYLYQLHDLSKFGKPERSFSFQTSTAVNRTKHGNDGSSQRVDKPSKMDDLTECNIKNVRRVDLPSEPLEQENCSKVNVVPAIRLCLFPNSRDYAVSRYIRKRGIWEPKMVSKFQELLHRHPKMTFIDMGANLGQYTMIAASLGHTVVAVEPNPETIELLKTSVAINRLTSKITLLQNAITDFCGSAPIMAEDKNLGNTRVFQGNQSIDTEHYSRGPDIISITMDALAYVVKPGSEVIIKMDIQGYEAKVLKHADKFFETNTIAYIFMEWDLILANYKKDEYHRTSETLVEVVSNRLKGKYIPLSIAGEPLMADNWLKWPSDVLWVSAAYMGFEIMSWNMTLVHA